MVSAISDRTGDTEITVTTALTLPLVEMAEIDRLVTEAESRIRSPVSPGVGMGMRHL